MGQFLIRPATMQAPVRRTAAGGSDDPAQTATGELFLATPAVAGDIFGRGAISAIRARTCIERGRVWQAEHHVGAVARPPAFAFLLREGLPAVQARGYDDLSAETLGRFRDAHTCTVDLGSLRAALAGSVLALMREGAQARLPNADAIAERLAELGSP